MQTSFSRSSRAAQLAILFAAVGMLLAPRAARAAGELTGRVNGYVYDPTGSPLSEVPLTLTSEAVLQQPLTRTTGEDGKFEFGNVPPAEDFVLEVNVPGFTPIRQTGIKVRLGQSTPVDVHLTVQTDAQAVATFQIIEKVNPVLNPDSAQGGAVITYEKAQTTPIFHQVEGMAQQVAGVGPGNTPSTRGGLRRYGKFYVDGMDTTDITDGSITAPMTFDAVDNFEIITGAMDAQYNSMGMITNAVTKNGSNEFKYDVSLTLQPSFAASKSQIAATQPAYYGTFYGNPQPGPDTSFYSPTISFGGPIIKDQLFYFVSYQQNFSTRENGTTVDNVFQNRNKQTTTSLGRIKLTYQPTTADRVSVAFNFDRNIINNNQDDSSVSQDAENKIHRGGQFGILNYDHNFNDNVLFQLESGVTYKKVELNPIFDDFSTPSHFDINSRTTRFNNGSLSSTVVGNFQHESKWRAQFDPTISWKVKALGTHQMKAGFQYAFLYDSQTQGVSGNQRFSDFGFVSDPTVNPNQPLTHGYGCDPTNAITFATCNQVTTYYNSQLQQAPLTTRAWTRTYGVFIQDRWTVNKQLTIIPGFRIDTGRLQGEQGLVTTPLTGIGPRLSATFDLFADRKTLIVAHAGRANDVGNIFIAQHGNPALLQVTAKWNNANSAFPTVASGPYAGAYCSPDPSQNTFGSSCNYAGGPAGRSFASGQTPPHVDELSGGIHHEVAPETVIGIDVTYRHYGNMWEDQEVNRIYDASGQKIVGYANPALNGQSVLQTVARSDAYRQYAGMDLTVQGTPGRWDLLASYTLSYNTGTVGDYFDGYLLNPRMAQFYDGASPDDRRHQLKGSVTYRTAFGLDLGIRFQYNSGTPLWESFTNTGDPTQRAYRSPRGTGIPFTNGAQLFNDPSQWSSINNPAFFNIDLQARYGLQNIFGLRQKAEVILLVVNALNSVDAQSLTDSFANTNSRFGLTSFRTSPLQAELMLRFRN